MSKRLTYKYVQNYFKEHGCELLEKEYKNSHTKMKYRCMCGDISEICFNSFKAGSRCQNCGGNKKYSLKYVSEYFKNQGCKLLEKEYKNAQTPMKYTCACGEISKINFHSFRKGARCKECGNHKIRKKYAFSFEYVQNYFKEQNCELLEKEYKNAQTPMNYICICKNLSKIRFRDFKNGKRCQSCKIKKMSGENNWKWNPNLTDEEREKNKNRQTDPAYKRWRRSVFKKDKYVCQKCFRKGGLLNAHHIESWGSNKELRLIKSNGICFCEKHHLEFHKKYGKKNNNKEQLDEFLKQNVPQATS